MDAMETAVIDTRTGQPGGEQRRSVDTAAAGSTSASASASTTGTLVLPDLSRLLSDLSAHRNIGLNYMVDQDTRRLIVKVIDRDTNEVLREIPSEEIRKLAAAMREIFGVLFDTTV